jgi:putative FmdB family regulatory protein
MPIYAYMCESCGHRQDVLQKLSDPLLTECPACKAATFSKQVTAAGFQLKGSGWYQTDFRNNGTAPAAKDAKASKAEGAEKGAPSSESAAPSPAPSASPAPSTPAAASPSASPPASGPAAA